MLTLYQTEWCPFSSAVREVLTELGADFVARQVEPWPEERKKLRAVTGTADPGVADRRRPLLSRHSRDLRPPSDARPVAVRGGAPSPLRPSPRRTRIGRLRAVGGVLPGDRPARGRGRIGCGGRGRRRTGKEPLRAAARRAPDRPCCLPASQWAHRLHAHRSRRSCEGRGFGSLLAEAALEKAAREGLEVAPLCPFIAHYIKRHPEYKPLLASGYADR